MNSMWMRRLCLALAAGLAVTLPVAAGYADGDGKAPGAPRIAYVNMEQVFKKYPLTQTLAKDLRAWKIEREKQVTEKKKELLAMRQKVGTTKGAESRNIHAKMIAANKEFTKLSQGIHNEYAKRLLANDRTVFKKIKEAIARVAAEEGFSLVFQLTDKEIDAKSIKDQAVNIKTNILLYGSPDLDLTDLVLEFLEEEEEGK